MSNIDELLKKMCPKNVEYKNVKELCLENFWVMPSTPNYQNEGIPYITSKNLKNGNVLFDDIKYINEEDYNDISANRPIIEGDFLISMIGTIGEVGIVSDKDLPFYGQNMYLLRLNSDLVDTKFFYHYFTSNKIKNELLGGRNNGNQSYLKTKNIEKLMVPIPSIEIQKKIAQILDKFEEMKRIIQEQINQCIIQSEYYKRKLMSSENKIYKISDFAINHREKNKSLLVQNAYSITQRGLIPTTEYFGEKTNITSSNTSGYYIVNKNWFVYSPSRIDVGSIGYLKDDGPVIVSPIDVVFSVDNDIVDNEYLLYYLLSAKGMSQILFQRQGIEGTGRKNLPFENFSKIEVPLPNLDEQKKIVLKIKKFEDYLNKILKIKYELYSDQYEYYRNKLLSFEELSVSE